MNTKDFRHIGLQIRNFREAKNISQEQLANQAGLSTATIGKIERGLNNPKADTLLRIAQELDIPCQLLFETNDRCFFTPQLQRLVQYAKYLNDDEVTALCLIAESINRIHENNKSIPHRNGIPWNDTKRYF